MGMVSLVGAGPGNPEYLTLLGRRRLLEADVVLYDRLVDPSILAGLTAELVSVGKLPEHHRYHQYQINDLLVMLAREDKRVVRLKAGDPYVFGRGGEEGQFLKAHGVLFEVVPGITSAIAGLAAAGIPITHRDYASSFHVITGHRKAAGQSLDWENIAHQEGTLVFLMGMAELANIVAELLEHGKKPRTPVAIIQWATQWNQRVVTAPLADIVTVAERERVGAPALIVVGEVVKLSMELRPALPLQGQRVLIPYKAQSKLFEQLKDAGATVGFFERAKTVPVRIELPDFDRQGTLIITDTPAFDLFKHRLLTAGFDQRKLAGWQLIAKNQRLAKLLSEHDVVVDGVFRPQLTYPEPVIVMGEAAEMDDPNFKGYQRLITHRRQVIHQVIDLKTDQTVIVPSSLAMRDLWESLDQTGHEQLSKLPILTMGEAAVEQGKRLGLTKIDNAGLSVQAVVRKLIGDKS